MPLDYGQAVSASRPAAEAVLPVAVEVADPRVRARRAWGRCLQRRCQSKPPRLREWPRRPEHACACPRRRVGGKDRKWRHRRQQRERGAASQAWRDAVRRVRPLEGRAPSRPEERKPWVAITATTERGPPCVSVALDQPPDRLHHRGPV